MKLYDLPFSPNARIARQIALEVDIPLELVPVDFTKGEHKKPDFIAMNPNGKVPVLQDGNYLLWESCAIATYLAALRPQAGLVPTEAKARADMDRWLHWKSCHLGPAIGKVVGERVIKPMFGLGATDENVVAQGFKELDQFAGVLDAHLAKHQFVANDKLSVADFVLTMNFSLRGPAKIDTAKWANLTGWLKRMESRPSFAATAPK